MNIPLDNRAIFLAGIVGGRAIAHKFDAWVTPVTTISVDYDRYQAAIQYLTEFGHHIDTTTQTDLLLPLADDHTPKTRYSCVMTTPTGWYVLIGQPRKDMSTMREEEWYLAQRAVATGQLAFSTPTIVKAKLES